MSAARHPWIHVRASTRVDKVPDVDWDDDSTLLRRVFYDHEDNYWAQVHKVEDNPGYGVCVFIKVITHRVSSSVSDNMPKTELREYIDSGEIEWIGYGNSGVQLAKNKYLDQLE